MVYVFFQDNAVLCFLFFYCLIAHYQEQTLDDFPLYSTLIKLIADEGKLSHYIRLHVLPPNTSFYYFKLWSMLILLKISYTVSMQLYAIVMYLEF